MANEINHSLIQEYLNELNKKLQLLPKSERELQISEVKDHMYQVITEKTKSGMDLQRAAEETLREFMSPSDLANGIISEENNVRLLENKGELLFKYGTMLTVGSFGGLSIPILLGELNLGIIVPFILGIVVGIALLKSHSIQWNDVQVKNLRWITRILIGFLGVPLTFYAIRIINDDNLDLILLSYLVFIVLLAYAVYTLLGRIYRKQSL